MAFRDGVRRNVAAVANKQGPPLSRRALFIQYGSKSLFKLVLDEDAETGTGHRSSLPRHSARQALTLESGRDVGGFAVPAKASEKFHDTSPCCGSHGAANVDWTGQLS